MTTKAKETVASRTDGGQLAVGFFLVVLATLAAV
jgi:hypothetical protein